MSHVIVCEECEGVITTIAVCGRDDVVFVMGSFSLSVLNIVDISYDHFRLFKVLHLTCAVIHLELRIG